MNGLSYAEINSAVVRDLNSSASINDYSDDLKRIVEGNWTTVRTQITTNSNMICSEFNFRFASNRGPHENVINFWPSPLSVSSYLIEFTRGVLYHYFVRRKRSFRVNFSPNLALISNHTGQNSFIWASRSNHGVLDTSYFCHSVQTFNHFIDVILKNQDLHAVMLASLSTLSQKYSDGFVAPLSLTFHITSVPSKIFGAGNLPLSQDKCGSGALGINKCVWLALSSSFFIEKCGTTKKMKSQQRKFVNTRRAKKLENSFLMWLKKRGIENEILSERIGHLGLPERYLAELEKFLDHSIILVNEKKVNLKKIVNQRMTTTSKCMKYFSNKTVSDNDYENFIYLLTKNDNHVQLMLDIQQYSKKFVCANCSRCFSTNQRLEYHLKAKVCEKKRFVGEQIVNFPFASKKCLSEIPECQDISLCKDMKYAHCLINGSEVGTLSLDMHIDLKTNDKIVVSKTFVNVKECASYIFKFSAKCAVHVLGERMALHFNSLMNLETLMKDYENCEKEEIDMSKMKRLDMVKKDIVQYLSKYNVYLSVGVEDPKMVNAFMYELLSKVSEGRECEDISVKFDRHLLQFISIDKFPVNFILLNNFGAVFHENRASFQMVSEFKNAVKLFHAEFDINIVGYQNITKIGKAMLASCLDEGMRNVFYSPSVSFSSEIDSNFVSYGVLNAQRGFVHRESKMKSALSIDFEKFYARLLMNSNQKWMYIGISQQYVRQGQSFVAKRSKKRFSFANMILNLIEFCCDVSFSISHLNGRERMRYGLLFDGVMEIQGQETYFEMNECIFHSCGAHCHENEGNMSPGHKLTCDVCKTDEMASSGPAHLRFLKPRLWKMKTNEQRDSVHAIKKNVTYDEDRQKTEEKEKIMFERSGKKVISITECQILYFWHKNVWAFMQSLELPCRIECGDIQMCTFLEQLTMQSFPLLSYGRLNHGKIVTAIKNGDLNGFIKCTTVAGPITRRNLGPLKPFFYKENGVSKSSHDVKEKIVCSLILKELLNNELTSDFSIEEIFSITEYKLADKNPFNDLQKPVLNSFKKHTESKGFIQALKGSLNCAIGSLGVNPNRYKNSYLMNEDDIKSMDSLHKLSHGTQVDKDKRLFHFASSGRICNLKHLHMAVISNGIALFCSFMLQFCSYFSGEGYRFNTDGCLVFLEQCFPPEILACSNLTSVILDMHLKIRLDLTEAMKYLHWKKNFFVALGVCQNHEKQYLQSLVECKPFNQELCCKNFINSDMAHPIKLEFLGDVAVVLSVNKASVYNSMTQEYLIKSSGSMDPYLSNIHLMNVKELHQKIFEC